MDLVTFDGSAWRTPLTAAAERCVGSARLRRANYRGVYHMEGVGGHEYYRAKGWLPVTRLEQRQRNHSRWETWMVDDPLHWYGMAEAVGDLPNGRILVAGLGLGLMLHHMAAASRFTAITVVEISDDVVSLIRPLLPADSRVSIVVDDFYHYLEQVVEPATVDGVLWDLAVGTPEQTRPAMLRGELLCAMHLPGVPLVQFGYRRRKRKAATA